MRSFATLAIIAFVAVAAISAQFVDDDFFDDDFGDFDDGNLLFVGGYSPAMGYGPLSSGYALGSIGSMGIGSIGMGSGISYGHGGKTAYIPYAVPTPVAAPPAPVLPIGLGLDAVQPQDNGLFGGNGIGLLCKSLNIKGITSFGI